MQVADITCYNKLTIRLVYTINEIQTNIRLSILKDNI